MYLADNKQIINLTQHLPGLSIYESELAHTEREREDSVVALSLKLKKSGSKLDPVQRCEPNAYQSYSR